MKANFYLLLLLSISCSIVTMAQQKIGGNPGVADPNAYLHLGDSATSNKGLLMPRVVLKATNDPSPLTVHKAGMYVYNVAVDTVGKAERGVVPGMYYNEGSRWVRMSNAEARVFIFGGPVASTPPIFCVSANSRVIYVDTATTLADNITPNPNFNRQWVCSGTGWVAYTPPPGQTEWFRYNTTIDAGSDKTGSIYRIGNVAVGIGQAAIGAASAVIGGQNDTTWGNNSVVFGGKHNVIIGRESGITAGNNNFISGVQSFIGGGIENSVGSLHGAISGGANNDVLGIDGFIGGGLENKVSSVRSAVVGGAKNQVLTWYSSITAGQNNKISSGTNSGITGGYFQSIDGEGSFIGGGRFDTISANYSVIVSGEFNKTSGKNSAIIGGHQLKNEYDGCVMIGDFSGTPYFPSNKQQSIVKSITSNSYTGMFSGGYRFLVDRGNQYKGVMIDGFANLYPGVTSASSLGTSLSRWSSVYAANGIIQTSDTRLKKNIKPLSYGLKEVLKIEPISYSWKDDNTNKTKVGVSAQQLKTVVPEVVNTGEDAQQTLGVNYAELVPVLINAIKEQQTQIEELKAKVKALESK